MTNKKCTHTKDDGTPCGAYAMAEAEFCYLHNPAISNKEKKLAQTRGGEGRALMTVAEPLPAIKLETPQDAIILIADTINRVRAGELDVRIANCIGVLSGHLIKAFETAQLKDKVEMIDRIILEKRLTKF